ncbi:hypothetical protein BH23BAC1_BH23BAC1_04360 [soil metagenome]
MAFNMRYYNPYHFKFFIPLAILAGIIYYLISYGRNLEGRSLIIMGLIILITIIFLGYHLGKQNHPLRGMHHERGEVEDILIKIIENKKGRISDEELRELKKEAQIIYNSSYRRAERTMRLNELVEHYLKKKN